MGDAQRHAVFAHEIVQRFPLVHSIADIAGGHGRLQRELRVLGVPSVWTVDKREGRKSRPRMQYRYAHFTVSDAKDFGLLVGMHPDAATDVIICAAVAHRLPFAVVPCCELPNLAPYDREHDWLDHLTALAVRARYTVERVGLPITGRNVMLVGRVN